jgi:hypothetical protein
MTYLAYRETMDSAPKIVQWVSKVLRSGDLSYEVTGSPLFALLTSLFQGAHFIVDDGEPGHDNFAELVDPLLDRYEAPPGMKASRMGSESRYSREEINKTDCYKLLSGEKKASSSLRDLVAAGVNKLGGVKAVFNFKTLNFHEKGEYGLPSIDRKRRWVLSVELDVNVGNGSSEGIKRRKINKSSE